MYQLIDGSTQFTETMKYHLMASTNFGGKTHTTMRIGKRGSTDLWINVKIYCFQMYKASVTMEEAAALTYRCS